MADIVAFPTDATKDVAIGDVAPSPDDRFLLEEGLELLADFRTICDDEVRSSIRALVKSLARQPSLKA